MGERYFLTGALGCIGAWAVKLLVDRGDTPVVFDLGKDRRRLRDLLDEDRLSRAEFVTGDITDAASVLQAVAASGARRVVHLAGLQVPACRADPSLGARVNVVGTLNVFAAAKAANAERVVYASSGAVYGLSEDDARMPNHLGSLGPDENAACEPQTHYGVFKRANEGNARIWWLDQGLSSVGLRPLTVYGVGRDQGLTSDPTRALKAAVLGRPFRIRFSGATDYLHARDAAAIFLAAADRAPPGAFVFNIHGESAPIETIIDLIHASTRTSGLVTAAGPAIPIPPALDGTALERTLGPVVRTPLELGFAETAEHFRKLQREGRLYSGDLDA